MYSIAIAWCTWVVDKKCFRVALNKGALDLRTNNCTAHKDSVTLSHVFDLALFDVHNFNDRCITNPMQSNNAIASAAIPHLLRMLHRRLQCHATLKLPLV